MDNIISNLPAYNALTSEQIQKLNKCSLIVNHSVNEQIFKQNRPGSYLMYVQSGLVKSFRELKPDKSLILKISGPGDYIGLLSVLGENLYQYSSTALEETKIIYIELPVVREIISENGKYATHFIQCLIKESLDLIRKIENQSQKQVHGRIAEILLFFSREIYKSDDFNLPISRQDLADLAISTKESVSRTLTEFKNDKIIEIDDKSVVIKSLELLEIINRIG
jgi:CRP/FNR family transcriptional regulator, polysaccharide utilization system transcription regulator